MSICILINRENGMIVVIGGGIGGLAAALGLARAGHRVTVLEKAPQFGEVGAGLQLGPNASRMLDRLGVLDAVHRAAVFPGRLSMCDIADGRQIAELDLGKSFRERYGYPYVVMHRTDLHQALLDGCKAHPAIALNTACDVVDVADGRDGHIVSCADGRRLSAIAVIGADGIRSVIRAKLIDDGEPIDSGYVAYRGAVAMAEMSEHAGLGNVVLWTGHEIHLVQYPVRRGELYNQVAVFRTPEGADDSDPAKISAELDTRYASTCAHVRRAIPTVGRARRWRLYDRAPVGGWVKGRVALLGDAAHPMLQYLAQGACQALEDAVCLSEQVARHGDRIEEAFRAYEALRAPRTARVQSNARIFGDIIHADAANQLTRNALLATTARDDFRYVNWLYGHAVSSPAALPIG
jgi:2-polyprenyl-6-methoxyphenol hydroxylase-like FAD-dependent oxidoreductase